MAKHNITGIFGEELAADYLIQKGYNITAKNWRYSHLEVDIIAIKDQVLHFVEVKTRRTKTFGMPEDNVSNKKMKHLISAAEEYLHLNPQWKRIQFDILSISIIKNKPVEYFFIEDAYL